MSCKIGDESMAIKMTELRYILAVFKGIITRRFIWGVGSKKYATSKLSEPLPIKVYRHKSLIRRTLGSVDPRLQENKAVNLSIAAPFVDGIIIKPGETFSFWKLVGRCTIAKGYKEGLVIRDGKPNQGVGGGMCQLSNLIHWMILHSPLTIVEHHHHNQVDMFPDFGRTIPFGSGTSIMYNYLDYQFTNNTTETFQLLVSVEAEYLCGEIKATKSFDYVIHVVEEDMYFIRKENKLYRHNKVYRNKVDKHTGNIVGHKLLLENLSKVMYDESFIDMNLIKTK